MRLTVVVTYLKEHVLVWLIPVVTLTCVIAYIVWLAKTETATPDSPFIYDL